MELWFLLFFFFLIYQRHFGVTDLGQVCAIIQWELMRKDDTHVNGKIFDAPSLRKRVIYVQWCYTSNIMSNQWILMYCMHFQ